MRHEESKIQRAAVKWFRYMFPDHVLLSIPNGGARNKIEAAILKAEGVLAGAADLFLACASKDELTHGLWIEVKTQYGRQTETQKAFQDKVLKLGYGYRIVRSLDEFIEVVNNYLIK